VESLKTLLLMAPMAGITDGPFRILALRGGADLVFTEMISARGIVWQNPKTLAMLKITPSERPISVQIFGDDPEIIGEASRYVYRYVKPEGIDLNFSCPVAKIRRSGAGAELLKNPQLLKMIVRQVRRVAPDIIVSAKIRPGINKNENLLKKIIPVLEDAGVDRITIHCRYADDFHDGVADWSIIRQAVKMTKIPIIVSGGINCPEDARRCLKETGCGGLMIGRAAIGNWKIFNQIKRYLNNGQDTSRENSPDKRLKNLSEHAKTIIAYYGTETALKKIRPALPYYLLNLPNARVARRIISQVETMEDIEKIVALVNI